MAKLKDKFFNRVIEGDLEFDGQVKGDLELESGSKAKIFENIVDKDGHPRFVEGDIELNQYVPSGVTKTYGKWSLSGTHLLIVLGLDIANATAINNGILISDLGLPKWIKDKIYPLWDGVNINANGFNCYADDWTTQTLRINLIKTSQGSVVLYTGGSLTLTAKRSVRIAYDLLIDDE